MTTGPEGGASAAGPVSTPSEGELREAARRGGGDAFGRLVGPYRDQLYAHCYRMLGSTADAEDALQETLLRAWRALPGFQGRSSVRSWLYKIATNACLRAIERRPRRVLPLDYGPAAETFVPAGVNTGTAGVLVDMRRGVLWTCAVDLTFQTSTALRAFDLRSGTLRATYQVPDRGVCADITLAHDDVYLTDTTDPIAGTPGRILRLTTPRPAQADGGTLRVWSADPLFTRPVPFLQINGITFDGISTLYTTNLSTGELLRVPIGLDGSAAPATVIDLDRDLVLPDGIRMLDPARLLVTEMVGRLTLVNIRTGTTAVVSESLDQPTSLVCVEGSLWVSEGQVLRLLNRQPPNLPFKVRRLSVTTLPPGSEVATEAVAS
jgi:DNA-directed RNA polymerase specialized sigma24 family protein